MDTRSVAYGRYDCVPDAVGVAGQASAAALGTSGAVPTRIETGKSGLARTETLNPARPLPQVVEIGQAPHEFPAIVALAQGAPFAQVIRKMLKVSDNTLAETLGRLVALHRGVEPTFIGSGKSAQTTIGELGVRLGNANLMGCSGLAHFTQIPVQALANLVCTATSPEHLELRAMSASLPVAGADGTLRNVYQETTTAGSLRGKTGILAISHSLAGTMMYQNQVLAYALIISGYPEESPGGTINAKQMFLTGLLGRRTEFSPTDPKTSPASVA